MKYKMPYKLFGAVILIILSSCWSSSDKITEEIIGTYEFKFPSGELSNLKINSDFSYEQKYFNIDKSNIKQVFFNKGKWNKTNDYEIYLTNYLEICYMRNPDSILPTPQHSGQGNIIFEKGKLNSKAKLSFYSENGYIFEKIK